MREREKKERVLVSVTSTHSESGRSGGGHSSRGDVSRSASHEGNDDFSNQNPETRPYEEFRNVIIRSDWTDMAEPLSPTKGQEKKTGKGK